MLLKLQATCISAQYFKGLHAAPCISRLYLKGSYVTPVVFEVYTVALCGSMWRHASQNFISKVSMGNMGYPWVSMGNISKVTAPAVFTVYSVASCNSIHLCTIF